MIRRRWAALLTVLVLAVLPATVVAHPLGNFTVNRYLRIEPGEGVVRFLYILDFAEIPSFQESSRLDTDGDGVVSPAEQRAYLDAVQATVIRGLLVSGGGRQLTLQPESSHLEFPPGQGGLPTTRIELWFQTPAIPSGSSLLIRDTTPYMERLGWREIVVRPGPAIAVDQSTVGSADLSRELRDYPETLLQTPPNQVEARFRVVAAGTSGGTEPAPVSQPDGASAGRSVDPAIEPLTAFMRTPGASPLAFLAALALAIGFGAAHALGPGHGKAMVGAYLVGSRGTPRHALILGLTVTATHTAGVYLLGLLTIGAAQFIVPERLYPILGVLSGATIILIGLMLTRSRLLQLLGRNQAAAGDHDHGHTHHQTNEAVLTHTHGGSTHTHTLTEVQDGISMRSLLALGVSGGLLPCPSALVVLLVAISLGNALLGMVLVAAFSLGLAGVLTGIGLLLVYGGAVASRTSLFQRVARTGVAKLVPVASAVAVTIAGGVITVQSL